MSLRIVHISARPRQSHPGDLCSRNATLFGVVRELTANSRADDCFSTRMKQLSQKCSSSHYPGPLSVIGGDDVRNEIHRC